VGLVADGLADAGTGVGADVDPVARGVEVVGDAVEDAGDAGE